MVMPNGFVRWWDIKPYPLPDSLDDLRGPREGEIYLSHAVYWAPGSHYFNVADVEQRVTAYTALLNEGTTEQACELMNKDLLLEVWPRMSLPLRVLREWHARFPQLHNDLMPSL